MAEQPQSMSELVRSVERVAAAPTTKHVVPTIATRGFQDLSTDQRTIALMMMRDAQAQAMSVANAAPGSNIIARQTDHWYRTHDPDGAYATLSAIVQTQSRRTR